MLDSKLNTASDIRDETAAFGAAQANPGIIGSKQGLPGKSDVRAVLRLAAESAFDLQDGLIGSDNVTRLRSQLGELGYRVGAAQATGANADNRLLLRRADQTVTALTSMIEMEVLGSVGKETPFEEIETVLQQVKQKAVDAAAALEFLAMAQSRI